MNNAGDSLSKAVFFLFFLWDRVSWEHVEFLADAISQSVYALMHHVSHDRHADVERGENVMRLLGGCALTSDYRNRPVKYSAVLSLRGKIFLITWHHIVFEIS